MWRLLLSLWKLVVLSFHVRLVFWFMFLFSIFSTYFQDKNKTKQKQKTAGPRYIVWQHSEWTATCAALKKPSMGSRVVLRCPVSLCSQLTPVCFLLFSLCSAERVQEKEIWNIQSSTMLCRPCFTRTGISSNKCTPCCFFMLFFKIPKDMFWHIWSCFVFMLCCSLCSIKTKSWWFFEVFVMLEDIGKRNER